MVQINKIDEFSVGQVWTCVGRAEDPDPRLVIGRMERLGELGVVAHVQIMGVKVYTPTALTGYSHYIGHAPFALDALRRSIKDVVGETTVEALTDFETGYQAWKRADDGGVWDVPVSEMLAIIESVLRKH
jgi:hypothetical protein